MVLEAEPKTPFNWGLWFLVSQWCAGKGEVGEFAEDSIFWTVFLVTRSVGGLVFSRATLVSMAIGTPSPLGDGDLSRAWSEWYRDLGANESAGF